MAQDIYIISGSDPKNGTIIVGLPPTWPTGASYKIDTYASNLPASGELLEKYDARFDDISYYTLGNSTIIGG